MNNDNCNEITSCIACGSNDLNLFFDLGRQPLANAYRNSPDEHEDVFPLAVNSCKNCRHVQLTHAVKPSLMFKNYAYLTGVSNTTKKFFDWFAYYSINAVKGNPKTVLDVGCNDGSQLDVYKRYGLETYGIDPAENICEIAAKNHNVVCDFFTNNPFDKRFDIVIIQNAFAHNNDQYALLNNLKACMSDNGLIFIATSQADMIVNGEFDTIYHEHISFYNTKSMSILAERCGLFLIDVQRYHIHGGSYIFVLSKNNTPNESVQESILQEEQRGFYSPDTLRKFTAKAIIATVKFEKIIEDRRSQGYKIVGYSSPAKGQTFLNYANTTLDFIIDDTPFKQNKYTPGTSIHVVGQEGFDRIEQDKVAFVILAWNFYDEIVSKIKAKRPNKQDIFINYFFYE
jgi:SAM-dependent methyltransferase